jgi:hypothetical protein
MALLIVRTSLPHWPAGASGACASCCSRRRLDPVAVEKQPVELKNPRPYVFLVGHFWHQSPIIRLAENHCPFMLEFHVLPPRVLTFRSTGSAASGLPVSFSVGRQILAAPIKLNAKFLLFACAVQQGFHIPVVQHLCQPRRQFKLRNRGVDNSPVFVASGNTYVSILIAQNSPQFANCTHGSLPFRALRPTNRSSRPLKHLFWFPLPPVAAAAELRR